MRSTRLSCLAAVLGTIALLFATSAPAAPLTPAYSQLLSQFELTHTIIACEWSEAYLLQARSQEPVGAATTEPTFVAALSAAITTRAGIACPGGVPAAAAARKSTDTTTGLIALAIALGLIALAAIWWFFLFFRGVAPRWWLTARHTLGEAGYRLSAGFADFGDWLRLGR